MQIRRSPITDIGDPNFGRIELRGDASGTAGSTDIATLAPLATQQTAPFTMVLALDQDSNSYEIFYKDGANPSQVLGLAAISRVRDANSIRFAVNNNLGSTNLFPTVIDEQVNIDRIALSDTNPLTDLLTLEVDRVNGLTKLINTSGATVSDIESISLTSDFGAVDADDLLSFSGTLAVGQEVTLSTGDGPWIKSPTEDLHFSLNLTGGETRTVNVDFMGNGGARWQIGDLNFDGNIDTGDWSLFIANAESDLSSFSAAEAYALGDLDSDGVNSVLDFGLFKNVFEAANGAGSFNAMIANVPEPNSAMLTLLAIAGLAISRRNIFRGTTMNAYKVTCKLLAPMLLVAVTAPSATATIFEEFLFNDPAGTAIPDLTNTGTGGHQFDTDSGTGGDANIDVVTNGLGQLDVSLKNNDFFGTNYADNDNITSGRVFGVMELTWDFQSTFDAAADEEIRLTFINNDPRGTQVTAQVEIQRTGQTEININGVASTQALGASNIDPFPINITQTEKFIAVLDADLDNDVYSVLFSDDAGGTFTSIGTGTLAPDRIVNSLRFVLNEDFVGDNVLIDRLYLTDINPAANVDLLTLEVNTTTGSVALKNDTAATFDIDLYRIESPTNDLSFANWNSLSDKGTDAVDGNDPGTTAGDGVGETWDEVGGADDGILSEQFLLGSSVFDPDEVIGLGNAFQVGGDLSMLEFQYRDAVTGNLFFGDIVEVTGLTGDYNGDNVVDATDYTTWRDNLGADSSVLQNNNIAGTITEAHYDQWKANYGQSLPASLADGTAPVPEPASCALLVGVVLLGSVGARSRQS